jgi:hypothetical protein
MKFKLIGFSLLGLLPLYLFFLTQSHAQSKVQITGNFESGYALEVNGKPFVIKGAGGHEFLDILAKEGGNSFRTWGIEQLDEIVNGKNLMDRAQENGLMVCVGIWLEHERHGFDYSDPAQVQAQRKKVRAAVEKWKDHPALLIWGLGNEMEGPASDGADERIWKEVNHLASLIKEIDPHHPVMTVIAGPQSTKIKNAIRHCPDVDILGINGYASAPGAGAAVMENGWKKPFVLAEFGPMGHWEVNKTSWGAPIEATSTDKAANYYSTHSIVVNDSSKICLGTYAFLWGNKQEATSTWYGMFLPDGTKLGTVDAMSYAWNGEWPKNRSPLILKIESSLKEARVKAGSEHPVNVTARDPEGQSLQYEWTVMAESTERGVGGDAENVPASFPQAVLQSAGPSATIRAPEKSGGYRVFLRVLDGHGAGATANLPFYVQ